MIEKILTVYNRVVTEELIKQVHGLCGIVEREGIFQSSIVLWLMMFQRLRKATLAEAVEELRLGVSSSLLSRASGSIKARTCRISGNTGGITQARERLSIEVVKAASDALSKEIQHGIDKTDEVSNRTYIIDGSTVRTQHTPKNLKRFPQFKNQYGEAHYPIVRLGVAIHATSGVALRPAHGPFNGKNAVSELTLASEVLSRLPSNSIVIGDRFYGCVSFALKAQQYGHDVICRIKEVNSLKYIQPTPRGECQAEWQSQKKETIKGRFVWETIKIPGEKPFRLVLFTTTNLGREKLLKLYAFRWNVELDLRDLKCTLEMESIDCRTPEMLEKELIVGFAAFNLVRHALIQMGNAYRVNYRQFSFSRFLIRLRALEGAILSTAISDDLKILAFNRALTDYKPLLLPKRKKKRPNEPRKVWPKGTLHILRGSRDKERKKLNNYKNLDTN